MPYLDDSDDEYPPKECIDSYQIWTKWRDSDVNSWPKCLQHFWWKIHDYESAQTCATNIRKYYLYDTELFRFASWIKVDRGNKGASFFSLMSGRPGGRKKKKYRSRRWALSRRRTLLRLLLCSGFGRKLSLALSPRRPSRASRFW
jgi:hypothetical protein